MKSYTDLEQSKRLAEFLPIESADMRYGYIAPYEFSDRMYEGGYDNVPYPKDFLEKNPNFSENDYDDSLPCWSLAALLDVLPDEISMGEGYQNKYEIDIRRYYGGNNITLYQIAYGNNKGSSGSWHDMISTSEQEKFVDVCYEMILKLHKLNLL